MTIAHSLNLDATLHLLIVQQKFLFFSFLLLLLDQRVASFLVICTTFVLFAIQGRHESA